MSENIFYKKILTKKTGIYFIFGIYGLLWYKPIKLVYTLSLVYMVYSGI